MRSQRPWFSRALNCFRNDERGSYIVPIGLLMPVVVGLVGLATEGGLWYKRHRTMQSAVDSAAISAAVEYFLNKQTGPVTLQAQAVTAQYGFQHGTNGVTVTVNQPPSTGPYKTDPKAVEIIVREPQERLLSKLFGTGQVEISARAVAIGMGGKGCVISLDPTASGATTVQGTADIALNKCSLYDNSNHPTALTVGGSGTITAQSVNVVGGITGAEAITTVDGIATNQSPISDPYADVPLPTYPSGCDQTNFVANAALTLNPGVYCNGIRLNAGANVTLNPGIYIIDRGTLAVNGGATLSGSGVTLVFTSSNGNNYANATINGGATITLTAPTTGPMAGIVFYGDRSMTIDTVFKLNGGSTERFGGAVYLPRADVSFAGGAESTNGCLQLIGNKVTFVGNANFAIECDGYATKPIASALAKLVE